MAKSKVYLLAYILFGVLSLVNCQTPVLVGRYVENESYGIKHDLSLHKDGSFQYIIKESFTFDTIEGEWNISGKKQIILSPKKTKSYHIESHCDTCAGNFCIKTYAIPDNYELTKPNVKVYGKGGVIEDGITNSVKYAIMQKADSIQINYFGFKPYVFVPHKKNNVIVKVFLTEEQQELLQRNRTLKIKKNKLVTEKGMILKKQL